MLPLFINPLIVHLFCSFPGLPGRVRDVPELLSRTSVRGGARLHVPSTTLQNSLPDSQSPSKNIPHHLKHSNQFIDVREEASGASADAPGVGLEMVSDLKLLQKDENK